MSSAAVRSPTDPFLNAVTDLEFNNIKTVSGLSPHDQAGCQRSFEEVIKAIASLAAMIEDHNVRYDRDFNLGKLSDPNERARWRQLKENEQKEVDQMGRNLELCFEAFGNRARALKAKIRDATIESALLQELTVGHSSGWDLAGMAMRRSVNCYGATFRLAEASNALEQQMKLLGITRDEKGGTGIFGDTTEGKINSLSSEMAFLKEEAAIADEALRRVAYDAANGSAWPKKFHQKITDELVVCREKVGSIGSSSTRGYYVTRQTSIGTYDTEITKILDFFKKTFSIKDERLAQNFGVSEEYYRVKTLLSKIICHREDVVHKPWELNPENKKSVVVYYFNQNQALQEEMKTVQKNVVAPRLKELQTTSDIFKAYLADVNTDISMVEAHLARLKKCMTWRNRFWHVEDLKPTAS